MNFVNLPHTYAHWFSSIYALKIRCVRDRFRFKICVDHMSRRLLCCIRFTEDVAAEGEDTAEDDEEEGEEEEGENAEDKEEVGLDHTASSDIEFLSFGSIMV